MLIIINNHNNNLTKKNLFELKTFHFNKKSKIKKINKAPIAVESKFLLLGVLGVITIIIVIIIINNNNNNNNNNSNNNMVMHLDHFSYRNCYQHGSYSCT